MIDLSRLLRPRSIAVVGRRIAETVAASRRLDYAGDIWPVHPTLEGAFRSLADLPAPPDAVFLAVNRELTVAQTRQLSEMGAGGVVAYAAGFAEHGEEGAALQRALVEAAGRMALIGPNCYGLLNYLDGAALWPDQHGGARVDCGVAIVTQSGNIGQNITMQRRALPLAYLVTLGNQAVVGLSDTIATLADDPRVTAIGLHIEGIDNAPAFAAAVAKAREAGRSVIAVKTGASEAGASATISHTASLAGADAVATAFLRRLGVARVPSLPVLLEALKILHAGGPLAGREIVSMSCSGGEAALMADRADHWGLRLRPFTPPQRESVAATLSPLVNVANPLDYHTFSWADRGALEAMFGAVLRCNYDMAALVLDYPRTDRCDEADWTIASDALADIARTTGTRAAVIATLPENLPESRAQQLLADGLVPLLGIDDAIAAIAAAASITGARLPVAAPEPHGRSRLLDEAEAKSALAAYGLRTPRGCIARDVTDAAAAFAKLSGPVALKALGVAHKTEHGAVRLNLHDADAVAAAARVLAPLGRSLLLEEMLTDGVCEVIAGVARDPAVGPYLVLGSGGILAELVADRAILMLPAEAEEIAAAIDNLRVAALLRGHRGKPPGDVEALVEAVLAIQRYAIANIGRLIELDVNPIIVRPRGQGAVAVDALIRLAEESPA
jgi:acyl-CoA synthetase (NDP forming)